MSEVQKIQTPSNARKRRFASTGERSAAPTLDEAVAEKAASSNMTGGKAVHSGAFNTLEEVPPAFSVKKSK